MKTLRRDLLKVAETCGVLADGRLLDEVYGYEPGWGFPSARDREQIIAIMTATDEPETRTEGPPETSEEGPDDTASATLEE